MRTPHSLRKGPARAAVVLGLIAVPFGFCAPSAVAASTTTTTAPRPAFSTASGTVAALSSATSSMEVQSPTSGQVTVSWTTTTRFSETVTVSSSQLTVGDCVTVTSATKKKTGPIAATTVSVRPSTGGSCTGAGGFGSGTTTPPTGTGGFRGGFGGGSFPRGTFPGGTFPRSGSGARRFASLGRFATGQVISKTSSSFVVKGFEPQPPKKDPASSTKTHVTTTSTTRPATVARKAVKTTVTFNAKTKFTTIEPASAATLAVGVCATALGPANDIGAITASTISITPPPKSGSCTAAGGFGGFFGGGRG